MQPRHALQAAAKQFGFDGTDASLSALIAAVAALPDAGKYRTTTFARKISEQLASIRLDRLVADSLLELPSDITIPEREATA